MKDLFAKLNMIITMKQKKGLVLLLLGALLVALLETVSVALMSPFMLLLTNLDGFSGSTIGRIMTEMFGCQNVNQALLLLSISFIILYLFRGGCKILYNFCQSKTLANYQTDLAIRLFSHVLYQPYQYHLQHNTAETQRLVCNDVKNCYTLINTIMLTGSCCLVSIGIFCVLIATDWKLTIFLAVLIVFFLFIIQKRLKPCIHKVADISFLATADMNKWVNQASGGMKNILVKRKQSYYVSAYGVAAENAASTNGKYMAIESVPKVLIDTMCMVMVFSVVALEVLIGNKITSSLPIFATFAIAALRLIPVIGQVTSTVNYAAYYRPSVDAIFDMIQNEEMIKTSTHGLNNSQVISESTSDFLIIKQGIELKHIAFSFQDADSPLFSDVNLKIPVKKSVAFVGTTGSGKTTLADIILGLHQPIKGKVLVDGKNIAAIPAQWANVIGYVPQFIYLCDDTIRSNVAFGDEKKLINDEWVWNCLEKAQMKEFVQSLPQGLDTITGENGIRLSGGQRQRIGIARALYSKPQFLLMDEATSALDNDTEKAIVDSINTLSGDLTLLIIAHRLSTISGCDIVYQINNGRATLEKGIPD